MKKLLTTSAIVVALSAPAIAQTSITGSLDIGYKALSNDRANAKQASGRGFGKEAQINVQNKGKLNLAGWEYAAGFALEDDGNQTPGSAWNENTYIDFINGNTTITIGQDHIQNNDQTTATFVGLIAEDMDDGGSAATIFLSEVGANPKESFGVGIMQTIPGFGRLSALYVPSNNNAGAGTQAIAARPVSGGSAGSDSSFVESDGESAYEIGFQGDLGVKGLNVIAFTNKEKATTGYKATSTDITTDTKGRVLGLSYSMGKITGGYTYKKTERGFAATTAGKEIKQDEFGLAYAVTPNLTLAANYTKADSNGTTNGVADAKMKSIAVGYNLGPVALTAQAAQLEDYDGTAGMDADVLYLRASTKF